MVLIDLKAGETARLALLPEYLEQTLRLAGEGHAIVLTGAAPVWLSLKVPMPCTARLESSSIALQLPAMW